MIKDLEVELEQLKASLLFRSLTRIDSPQSFKITIGNKEYISLCSNNYLGLANHQALIEASIEAVQCFGSGAGASRLVSGNMALHEKLERVTAAFKETEASLLFNTGCMANMGLLQALADERDAIFSDELNHASIIDGCRLSRAKVFIYRHRDAGHLRSLLSAAAGYRRRIVVTESVFSMDGDIAPLPDISIAAEEYGAILIVDEAHATGVLGWKGSGSAEHFRLAGKDFLIQMGTYGKALGSFGAYVAGSSTVREYLINRARTFIYTTALPPSVIAASIAAITILQEENERLQRLHENAQRFRDGLRDLGFNTMNSETPIIPILIGDADKTVQFSERLFESGVYAVAIRPPTVPEGSCRIRTTVTADHSKPEIEFCLNVFEKEGKRLRIPK